MRCRQRFTAASLSASSRQGKSVTRSRSPMVWPVAGTMRRIESISSPKNSRRTGALAWDGKTSTESPSAWKVPGLVGRAGARVAAEQQLGRHVGEGDLLCELVA